MHVTCNSLGGYSKVSHNRVDTTSEGSLSRLEEAWGRRNSKSSTVVAVREYRYDPGALMFYTPSRYIESEIIPPSASLPNDVWITKNLDAFVLGQPGGKLASKEAPLISHAPRVSYVSDSVIEDYLHFYEREVIYGSLLAPIYYDKQKSLAEKVHLILSHPVVGNPQNTRTLDLSYLSAWCDSCLKQQRPLQFVLPAFPFKDQNPFRTNTRASHVDFGEVSLLIHLYGLSLALAQIYPFGIEWIITSDGTAYSDIFQINRQDAILYRSKLRMLRSRLNLQNSINIIDLQEMIEGTPDFELIRSHLEDSLNRLYDSRSPAIVERLNILARGMRWNLNTRTLLPKGVSALWRAIHQFPPTAEQEPLETDLAEHLRKEGLSAAVKYAAFSLTMKILGLYDAFFPAAIRATVHPKVGQVAIPHAGNLYPWNGVCVVDFSDVTTVEITEYHRICALGNLQACVLYGDTEIFYYMLT